MTVLRRWAAVLCALACAFGPLRVSAAVKDAVLNKEGVWAIDVDNGACALSRTLSFESVFLFRAQRGAVTFGYFPKAPMKTGRTGRFELGALGFDFRPSFGDGGETLYLNGEFDPQIVSALRAARELRVLVDGRPVVVMNLGDTGFAEALDGVIACSKGEEGWWGKGVQAAADGPSADKTLDGMVMNKEGVWGIVTSAEPGVCVAQASIDEQMQLQILAAVGREGLAVGSGKRMPAGKRARVETNKGAFDVAVSLDKARLYLTMDDPLTAQNIALLYDAKWLKISMGREALLDIQVDDTGFTDVLDAVAACSQGRGGWWGKGATPRG